MWEIKYEIGFAIDKFVDVVVNSSNNYLLLGSSGSGRKESLYSGRVDMESNSSQFDNMTPPKKLNQDSVLSQNESNAKKYIEQYKSNYSRDDLKAALVGNGMNADEVNNYLNKYYGR